MKTMNDPPIAPGQAEWETRFACMKVVLAPEYAIYIDILRAEHHTEAWESVARDVARLPRNAVCRNMAGVPAWFNAQTNRRAWRKVAEELRK